MTRVDRREARFVSIRISRVPSVPYAPPPDRRVERVSTRAVFLKRYHQIHARDARIAALWEGTTGIQALDLLGRKIMMHGKMKPINEHCAKLYAFAGDQLKYHCSTSSCPVPDGVLCCRTGA